MTGPSLEGRRPLPPLGGSHVTNGRSKKPKPRPSTHRFGQINEFFDQTLRTVGPVAGLVWVGLWREARPPEWTATVAQKWLCERIGVSESTLKRAVKELEEAGLVTVLRRGNSMTGSSSYAIRSKRRVA